MKKAREAGLFVIALDTAPDPPNTVDITFATDNVQAGQLIGQWAAATARAASPPSSPCSTCSTTRSCRSTTTATRASSKGWASTPEDPRQNGDEAKTGKYTGGTGGTTRSSATSRPRAPRTAAAPRWRSACRRTRRSTWSTRSTSPPRWRVRSAQGGRARRASCRLRSTAAARRQAASSTVSSAPTAQQYPRQDGELGMEAIARSPMAGRSRATAGLDFFDTGIALVTDKPVDRRRRASTLTKAAKVCWGTSEDRKRAPMSPDRHRAARESAGQRSSAPPKSTAANASSTSLHRHPGSARCSCCVSRSSSS